MSNFSVKTPSKKIKFQVFAPRAANFFRVVEDGDVISASNQQSNCIQNCCVVEQREI